ncbi:MAG: PLP-dependent aminotransferase family protein [Vallitaleaceae bacterium]|nr:PLP-dependent aminotransferase family protein [Vallitaleaceae bacterium]
MGQDLKYRKLYHEIKENILVGAYPLDETLPSIRKLSSSLHLSKTTIENAYNQLLLEGYVYAIQGVGYYANQLARTHNLESQVGYDSPDNYDNLAVYDSIDNSAGLKSPDRLSSLNGLQPDGNQRDDRERISRLHSKNNQIEYIEEDGHKYIADMASTKIYDFRREYVDSEAFDMRVWKRHINHVLTNMSDQLILPVDDAGEMSLRRAIAQYIYLARGIEVISEDIYIDAGIQSLLTKLIAIIRPSIDGLAIEDPGFSKVRDLFEYHGCPINPVPLTRDGIDMKVLRHLSKQVCYVSPAHQFPTGKVMQIENRYQLMNWANESDSYILEDDYNAELRYDLFPVPSLKSMDQKDRVIYLGSFSTYLLPAIRISYIILPKGLQEAFQHVRYAGSASKLEQLAFAHMIETGDYRRHINRMKKHYAKKTDYIHQVLVKELKGLGTIIKNQSGLNVLIRLDKLEQLGKGEEERLSIESFEKDIIIRAREQGIHISGLHEYTYASAYAGANESAHVSVYEGVEAPTLVLNYRGIEIDVIESAIHRLKEIFEVIS